MLLTPDQYDSQSVTALLTAAATGKVGVDRALMHSIVDRGSDVAPEIAAFALAERESDRLIIDGDLFHVLRVLRHPSAIPFYIELLQEDDDEASDEIYLAMAELGEAAVKPLLTRQSEVEGAEQSNIEFLLAGLHVHQDRIKDILLKRLDSDPYDAAINLALYGDRSVIPILREKIAGLNPEQREYANLKRELEFALRQLEGPSTADAPEPYDIDADYPEQALPAFDVLEPEELVEYLDHPDADVRRGAAESLLNERLDEGMNLRLLALADSDPDVHVRAAALQSLGHSVSDKAVAAKLEEKVRDINLPAVERAAAAVALVENGLTPELRQILEELYKDPDARALSLRGMWHSFDKTLGDFFPPHLEDEDAGVQREAIWGVGYLGMGHQAGKLEALLENEDVRDHALFAYALSLPAEISRGRIKGLFRKIEQVAGGLSSDETELVEAALDQRLAMHGLDPVFHQHDEHCGHAH